MNQVLTTFPTIDEFQRALALVESLGLEIGKIEPPAALSLVAVPALIMTQQSRARFESAARDITFSGWVDYHAASSDMPAGPPPDDEDESGCFRRAMIVVLSPCVADLNKIRLIAHIDGDMAPVLPYLNSVMPQASYTPDTETLTIMDGHRMVALYPRRITIAKADEIVDAWLTLERIRQLVEGTWADREQIAPCFETRRKPPALEIFKRLPGTNCGQCGVATCLALATQAWMGAMSPRLCHPVFDKDVMSTHLKEPLLEICAGMGISGLIQKE